MTRTTTFPLYWAAYGPEGTDPLLVLHGGPGAQHDYLLPQMLALAADRECIFYDQRGNGRSQNEDRAPVTWRSHVADLAAVAAELGLHQKLTLVGYSWGALLAMLYAIETARETLSPEPSAMVLIDPAPVSRAFRHAFEEEFATRQRGPRVAALRDELAASGLRESDPETYRHRLFELGVAGYFHDPRAARELTAFRVLARIQQSVWESLGDFDLTAPSQLDLVHVPSLIVHGRQDPIPLESSQAAANSLDARLVVLEQCGHVPYVEQPAALFAAIGDFLDSLPSR
jgi:proline iminopeptidase